MFKKSLFVVAAALFLSSVFMPGAFAFTGHCTNGHTINLQCAKNLASTSPTEFKNLINQVNIAAAGNPKYDKLLHELVVIAGNKSAKDANAAK